MSHRLGQLQRAEIELTRARKGFAELGLPYPTALIALDLALLYLEQGRTAEVKELSTEVSSFFRSRRVHPETIAAALLFERAGQTEAVTQHFIRELSSYLTNAQSDPELRFRPTE